MKTLYESILDDEDEVMDRMNDIEKDLIKKSLNLSAGFELNKLNIKITSSNEIYPTMDFIKLKDYTFTEIPNLNISTKLNFDLLNPAQTKQWPHINHIGQMTIYIHADIDELNLSELNIDNIDTLNIIIHHRRQTPIKITGHKQTKINLINFKSFLNTSLNPNLIRGFDCKKMLLYASGEYSIAGIRGNLIRNAAAVDIYDEKGFNELITNNNIKTLIYRVNINMKENYFTLKKDGENWIYKKTYMKF